VYWPSPGARRGRLRMQSEGDSDKDEWRSNAWWAMLAGKLLHPVQVASIEAFSYIGLPLCVRDLAEIIDETEAVHLDYHVGRLRNLGALEVAGFPQTGKDFVDIHYELTPERSLGERR
jgi:hypothetical protein